MTLKDVRYIANVTCIIVSSAILTISAFLYVGKYTLIDIPLNRLTSDKFATGECVIFANVEPWAEDTIPIGKITEVGKNFYMMIRYDYVHAYGGVIDDTSPKAWTESFVEPKARINTDFKIIECPKEDL